MEKELEKYIAKANALLDKGQVDKAILTYKEALKLYPEGYPIYKAMGDIYFYQKNYKNAAENYLKAIEFNSADPYYHLFLSNAYYLNNEHEKAKTCFQVALNLEIESAEYYYALAQSYSIHEKYIAAEKNYKKAITYQPLGAQAYFGMGLLYNTIYEYDKAIRNLKQAISFDSSNPVFFSSIAHSYQAKNDYINAINYMKKAVALNPNFNKALAVLEKNKNKEPVLIKSDPSIPFKVNLNDENMFFRKGYEALVSKNYELALKNFDLSVYWRPRHAIIYCLIGLTYLGFNDKEKAIVVFEEAKKLNPLISEEIDAVINNKL